MIYNVVANVEALLVDLDLVEEVRNEARIQEETCKRRVTRKYNSKLRRRNFITGDLVWRMRGDARKNHLEGMLSPNWEGPFQVVEPLQNRACKFEDLAGKVILRTQNETHLKPYYS